MRISAFSVKNSLFINLLSVFIIVAGIVSLSNLKREAFPPIDYNVVLVTGYFRGASAEKVEKLLTIPMEREIREVDNIEEIYSTSNEGMTTIAIKISEEVKNLQKVVTDIQKAVDRVTDLPEDVDDRPIVTEINAKEIPIIKIALSGIDEMVLRRYADDMTDQIEEIPGVASVKKIGWRDEEFWVEPDSEKMIDYHISFKEITSSLAVQNVDTPGGKQEYLGKEFTVKVKGEIKTKEDIENTVIRANDLGNWVKVKDVATVRHAFQDDVILNKAFGSRSIILTVMKRENGDIIDLVDEVYKIIDTFKKRAPSELNIAKLFDLSYYVKRRLKVLQSNGIIGLFLVVLVLFIFLPPIPALMTALGIPIAFFTTFFIMSSVHLTINLLTMFGLIMVLGIIVDDGIIISENVFRHIEMGKSPKEAAISGTNEVARPVIATVLTTVVAFSPLMMMTGIMGKFVKFIPFVVIIALGASLVEAFIILPSHLADFARKEKGRSRKETWWFKLILNSYKWMLYKALKFRYIVLFIFIAIFVGTMLIAKFFIPFVLFPAKGIEQFAIVLEATSDTSLKTTNSFIQPVEEIVATIPNDYLDTYETIVGMISEERGFDPNEKQGSNYGQINVYLTPTSLRDKTSSEIIALIKDDVTAVFKRLNKEGVTKLFFKELGGGPPIGKAIDVRIRGEDYSVIMKIINKIKNFLEKIEGVTDISDSYNIGAQELQIVIDEKKAQKVFLSNSQIAFAIRAAFSGVSATTIKRDKAEKEIRVLVRYPESKRNDPNVFDSIVVANKFGNLIQLKDVTKIVPTRGMRSVQHIDGKRFVAITADVDDKTITSVKANKLIKKEFSTIPFKYPGYSLKFGGEEEESRKSMESLVKAFFVAILLIYVILATQFNSLFQPFIVMVTIPFGLIGFIIAFLIHKEPLSFLGIMGFIGLTGVVVNDSIVLVDFINKRRNHKPLEEAALEAGILRLRPVLITTITTVCGLATVAYGIGGLDPFLQPMALAMSWGLAFATVLTLILIPCFYVIAGDVKKILRKGFLSLFSFKKNEHITINDQTQ
ncbi:efflux RND transporter permease subunit [Chlamydiota bacterium]